jgi:uncharacterized Tic20 family protein
MALDNLKNYIIGIILAIALILCGVFLVSSFSSNDSSIDTQGDIQQFNRTLALSQNITTSVDSMNEALDVENAGALGWIDAIFRSTFSGLKATKQSTEFVGVATKESAKFFGIERVLPIISVILLIVAIIILIAIYEAITRQ